MLLFGSHQAPLYTRSSSGTEEWALAFQISAPLREDRRYHQPAESDQIVFFNPLDLYWNSPESSDLQCKYRVSKTTI